MMDFSKFCPPHVTEEHAEEMGRDCRLNGANTKNCAFYLFSKPELTRAWERGNRLPVCGKTEQDKHAAWTAWQVAQSGGASDRTAST